MKFSAAALFVAATASAAAVKRSDVFAVSDFSASCIRHSSQCLYYFGVLQTGTAETTPVICKAMATANTGGTLPSIANGACENSSRTFTVTKSNDGLTLTVTQPVTPSSNQSGSHLIPSSELAITEEPNATIESYTGPVSFTLQG